MSDPGKLFYFLAGISGVLFLFSLLWEAASRLTKEHLKPVLREEKEPADWDPFKHLAEINKAADDSASPSTVEASSKNVSSVEAREDSDREDPWKNLMRDQLKDHSKRFREVEFDSESSPKEDKT